MAASSRPRYFAAEPTSEFVRRAHARVEEEVSREQAVRMRQLCADAWVAHYAAVPSQDGSSARPTADGEQDQLVKLRTAKVRAQANAYLALLLGPQMAWRPQATNADADARAATMLAQQMLESHWKLRGMRTLVSEWAEAGLVFGESYLLTLWDRHGGKPLHVETDETQGGVVERVTSHEGDVTQEVVLPWRVTRDGSARSPAAVQWRNVTVYRSRYDLAECYGRDKDGEENDKHEAILLADPRWKGELDILPLHMRPSEDDVPVSLFFHKATPAVPFGRFAAFIGPDICLWDLRLTSEYPDGVPLARLAFGTVLGTADGYTPYWDMLAASSIRDDLVSAAATNNTAGARQTFATTKGSEFTADKIGAVNLVQVPPGIPVRDSVVVLDTVKTPAETYSFIDQLAAEMQAVLGLNDVSMGQPQRGGSGASYALLASTAVQQAQPQQQRILDGVQEAGQTLLSVLAKHVTEERVLEVVGESGGNVLSESKWTGSQLKGVKRVIVEMGNPVEQTAAGRFELAQMYVKNGWVQGPEQLQQVLSTGRMEPLLQAQRDQSLLIQAETQALQRGEKVVVHPLDNHALHAREHVAAVMSMDARANPAVVEAAWHHVQAHYLELYGMPMETDPMRWDRLQAMLGYLPPSALAPPPMPGPMPMDAGPILDDGQPDALGEAGMPGMPTNPLTGQQFDAQTGGGVVAPPQ
jgi:hypothetical protein